MARAPAALPEGVSESLSAEESQLLADDRAAERAAPEVAAEPAAAQGVASGAAPAESVPAEAAPTAEPSEEQKKANAVTQERERRKAAEKEAREAQQQLATIKGRFEVLQQLAQQSAQPQVQAPQAPEIPDYNADPLGNLQARLEIAEVAARAANEQVNQFAQQSQIQNNVQRLLEIAHTQEVSHARENPDYLPASQFLRDSRERELAFMGTPTHLIPAQLNSEIAQLTAFALERGITFPQAVSQVAQMRGYQPVQAAPAPTPAAAPVVNAAPTPEERIQQVQKGQEMTQSIGQVAGTGAAAPMTLERLAKMSDEEFAAATQGNKWRDLLDNAPRS
jgi:hypothetical protein